MGYPAYNLTTLQLPAPSSNMTKAEYKTAYGIDLDSVNIPSFKLVIFGKDKFPIDQIKEVEDGYEIYFNGRILSITDIVQTSDEVYDVANSKPIYYHPIYMDAASDKFRVTLSIMDNRSTPYDASTALAKLKALMDAGAIIQVNGFIKLANELCPVYLMYKSANEYRIYAHTASSAITNTNIETFIWPDLASFVDGVNKLN